MSDNIDHNAMVQAACLADLGRHRQDELPLSNEPRRGPTFAPNGRNGTKDYSNHRKIQLVSKWGAKIEDEETRQMEGLEIEDARPWARGLVAEALFSNLIQSDPPPRVAARRSKAKKGSSQPQRNGHTVHFKPSTDAWKDTVKNMVKNSPVHSPLPAKWGPPQSKSAPSAAPQGAVPESAQKDIANNCLSNETSGNGAPAAGASPSVPPANGTMRGSLTFNLHQDGFDSNAIETIIGSGHCQVVPSKNEALSFTSSVVVKIHEEKGGVLALRSKLKGDKIHDVLDIDKPLLDGQYCVVKVKSHKWPYHIRFDNNEHVKIFKACLSRVKKAVRIHKKPENEKASQAADAEATVSIPDLNTVPSTTDTTCASTVSTIIPEDIAENETNDDTATTVTQPTVTQEELIPMDDDWDTSTNPQVPVIREAINPMVALVRRCLEYFNAEGSFCAGTIAGIEDAILDKWEAEGFLKDCDERQREASFAMLRTFVDVELILSGKKAPGMTSESNAQQESRSQCQDATSKEASGSVKRPRRGVTLGLGASRFAKKPFPCEGSFTGPRSQAAYK